MPFPRRYLGLLIRWIQKSKTHFAGLLFLTTCLFTLLNEPTVWALNESQPIHFSGDQQKWNRKANIVELFGNAAVSQPGETLTADYIHLNLNNRNLDAKGKCVYLAADSVIWGEEMHFNLDTRTGTVVEGRVSDEKFTLTGELIHKMGVGHFKTHWGNYTTCKDCSASWSLLAETVDMQVDGYAYLSNVTTKIKDAPAFWLPYLVVPVKSRRQSGLLFPQFTLSGVNGATFVLPFFWSINRSADMTFGMGEYTLRGHRFEWETRYALSERSGGRANAYYLTDKIFGYSSNRWGVDIAQTQELPWKIEEKLRLSEVSDNIYPFQFGNDFASSGGEAFLASKLIFSYGSGEVSGFVAFQRYRNLLNSTPGDVVAQNVQFDPRTVQAYPNVLVTTNEKKLWDTPLFGGLTIGATRFTRSAGPFDYDTTSTGVPFGSALPPSVPGFTAGIDPIREATRVSITPSLYTTFRPFDVISLVPSLQYHYYFYDFHGFVPVLRDRGYLLFQVDLTTQLEKIYEFPDDLDIPRVKHLIRPMLTYSLIPFIQENAGHPFVAQIRNAQSRNQFGYNFDDNDIVPYSYNQSGANYFVPQGHSLSYGFTTQWIRRRGNLELDTPTYQTLVEFSAGQAINFLEIYKPQDPTQRHIFTRFFSTLQLNMDRILSQTTYYYYPDIPAATPRHTVSTSATYIISRGLHQQVLAYDRSFTLAYTFNKVSSLTSNLSGTFNFSLSDYILPYATINYSFRTTDIQPSQLLGAGAGVQLQNPSRCWKLTLGSNYASGLGISTTFDLSLNLTGTGFGGVTELANQAMTR